MHSAGRHISRLNNPAVGFLSATTYPTMSRDITRPRHRPIEIGAHALADRVSEFARSAFNRR